MLPMQTVAVLYLDEEDRKFWSPSLDRIPELFSITVAGCLSLALDRVRRLRGSLGLLVISARLYPGKYPELARLLRELAPGLELLLISSEDSSPALGQLFADDIRHLAIDSRQGVPSRGCLPAVVSLLIEQRHWEIGSCLKPGTTVYSFQLRSSEDKEPLIAALEAVLTGDGEEIALLREKGALLADELLENALYNAPRGSRGDRLFQKGERRDLLSRERIVFSFGFDGETLALKLTDNWGSLAPDSVLEYLARNQEEDSVADGDGGRGLFIIWRFLDQFHVEVLPGQQTAVGGHLQLSSRLDPEAPRGFHIAEYKKEMAA